MTTHRGKTLNEWKEYIKKDGLIPIRTKKYIIVLEELIERYQSEQKTTTKAPKKICAFEHHNADIRRAFTCSECGGRITIH